MQSFYPAAFERDMGCTATEWLSWLPGAVRDQALTLEGDGAARVDIADGHLQLRWQVLPPRQIALMRLPRLQVDFQFDGVEPEQRLSFMKYFDLFMHRGGG